MAANKKSRPSTANELMLADLARSGLTRADAQRMGLQPISPGDESFRKLERAFPGLDVPLYEIRYFGEDRKPTGHVRFRLLGEFTLKGDKKPAKYLSLPGSKNQCYFPPVFNLDWRKILKDKSTPITIVEGEKKAYALAKLGEPAIGIAGVWSWSSADE